MILDQTANQLDKVNWRIFTNTTPIYNLLSLTKRERMNGVTYWVHICYMWLLQLLKNFTRIINHIICFYKYFLSTDFQGPHRSHEPFYKMMYTLLDPLMCISLVGCLNTALVFKKILVPVAVVIFVDNRV